jgi:hypothetical protein
VRKPERAHRGKGNTNPHSPFLEAERLELIEATKVDLPKTIRHPNECHLRTVG